MQKTLSKMKVAVVALVFCFIALAQGSGTKDDLVLQLLQRALGKFKICIKLFMFKWGYRQIPDAI